MAGERTSAGDGPAGQRPGRRPGAAAGYALAIVAILVVFALKQALSSWLGPPYILFYPTVMLVALAAGLWPGLLAVGLSAWLTLAWILPAEDGPPDLKDLTSLAIFVLAGSLVCLLADRYRRARERVAAFEQERALHASEARARAMFEQAAVGVAYVETATGRFLQVNPRLCELIGRPAEVLLAGTWRDFTHPDDLGVDQARVERMSSSGEPYRSEKRYLRPDGSVVWAAITVSPVSLGTAEVPTTQVAVVEDISERRHVQEVAATEARRQRFLVALADTVRPIVDPVEVKRRVMRLLGEELRATRVHFGEISADGAWVEIESEYRVAGAASTEGRHHLDDHGPQAMEEFRAGHNLVIDELASDPRLTPAARATTAALGVAAYVVVPLEKSGRAVAMLVAHQDRPRRWTPEELRLMEEAAERTWSEVERARADAARRESEERYRLLADHVHDVIWTIDLATGHYTYLSPSVHALRGFTVEEALAQPLEARFTAASLTRLQAVLGRIGTPAEEDPHLGVYDQPCRDGSVKQVEITASLLRDGAGRAVGVVGVSRDVSARVQAEQRLEARERQLDTVLDTALDAFWVLGEGGTILRVNDAACTLSGYTREELLRMRVADLEALEDGSAIAERQARIAHRGHDRFETRHRRKDGRTIDVEVSVQRGDLDGGRLIAFVRDITEARQAREVLQQSEARFRALIERSTDLVVVTDREGLVTFWSPSAEEALGWAEAELLGTPTLALVHPEDHPLVAQARQAAQARPGELARATLRMRHRDGSWRLMEFTGRSLFDHPAVRGMVLNARDVTAQRALEEQLRQAQKLESIGRLAGGVAHDFNNLLTVILSCAESLGQELAGGPAEQVDEVAEIRAAAERARDLTRQLLAFARKHVVAPTHLDLNAVVGGARKMLERILGEEVDLQVRLDVRPCPIHADPGQMEQVLLNLVVNASDAMPRGGTLTIETVAAEVCAGDLALGPGRKVGRWSRLVVRDTGEGMAPEVQAHLFEPFFTTKDQGKGTGLGLASVHGIVNQGGGHLHVQSAPGHGSTFEVCFPRHEVARTGEVAPRSPAVRGGTETLLLVEDDELVRAVTVRTLKGAGYQVVVAALPAEALALPDERLAEARLLVTDVVMPGMDGPALAAVLREKRPALPVLFLSGHSEGAIADRGVLKPGIEFLAKPYSRQELLGRIRGILDREAPARQPS